MRVVKPQAIILSDINEDAMLERLERAGRTAYKSEDAITPGSAATFVQKIIKSGHESVLEHEVIQVRFICDRGVTHELVRHRIAAYTQESTRYVNYRSRGMEVIEPCFWPLGLQEQSYRIWRQHMGACESAYNRLLIIGASPQEARSVLPNSLKTEIVTTMNLREWRHVLRLRTAPSAHPQMREMMNLLAVQFVKLLPSIFGDVVQ